MADDRVVVIEMAKILHKFWSNWAKELLRDAKINPDGSRTLSPQQVKKYITDIIITDPIALATLFEDELMELSSLVFTINPNENEEE